MTVTEIAPGVVVVETSTADGKVGVIAGDRVAMAVDAGIDDAEGASVAAAARSMKRPRVQLVYTHGHIDHAFGGTAFRDHDILASPAIATHMAAQVGAWAERSGEGREALEARLGWPTIMFEAGGELDLGGRLIRLLDTPGHAPGALCVHDPDASILFGGDTIVTGIPPYFKDGDSRVLEVTLRSLADLDSHVLIPGHGDVVRGGAAVRSAILWEADYLARCRVHVISHLGDPLEAIIAAAPFESYIGDHLAPDRHQMVWRHQQVISMMVDEEMT
jgi:glyoxylase-like metal-dependent hydrolase (beta-lactamase superfamily II)